MQMLILFWSNAVKLSPESSQALTRFENKLIIL